MKAALTTTYASCVTGVLGIGATIAAKVASYDSPLDAAKDAANSVGAAAGAVGAAAGKVAGLLPKANGGGVSLPMLQAGGAASDGASGVEESGNSSEDMTS